MTSSSDPRGFQAGSFCTPSGSTGGPAASGGVSASPFERHYGGSAGAPAGGGAAPASPSGAPGWAPGMPDRRSPVDRRIDPPPLAAGTVERLARRIAEREAELQAKRAGGVRPAAAIPQPAAPAPSPYARFIPREELVNYDSWQPDTFAGGRERPQLHTAADLEAERQAAERAAAAQAALAERQAQQRRAAQEAEHRAACDQAYAQGREAGLAEFEALRQRLLAEVTAPLSAVVDGLQQRIQELELRLADQVASIALELGRQVVRSELQQRPEAVVGVAQEALGALLASARYLTLQLHPEDYSLVAEGAGDLIAARGVRLVADRQIERGGCLLDSDIALIDATMAQRWQRATAAMGQPRPWKQAESAGPGAGAHRPGPSPAGAGLTELPTQAGDLPVTDFMPDPAMNDAGALA